MFRRRSKFVVQLTLALALLIAQAGALLHAGTHDAVGSQGGAQHTSLCGKCLSFSTVLSAAGSSGDSPAVLFVSAVGVTDTDIASLESSHAPHHFWSRGPPSASSC